MITAFPFGRKCDAHDPQDSVGRAAFGGGVNSETRIVETIVLSDTSFQRQVSRDYLKHEHGLCYEDITKHPGKNHQKNISKNMSSHGWKEFDMGICMESPKR